MMHETELHRTSWFTTLTYSPEALPDYGALSPDDPKGFVKRLRNAGYKFRYYLCGEYGERERRPHYHAVFFGLDFPDRFVHRRTSNGPVWRSETLERFWPHGFVELDAVTWQSASYVAGYVTKKLGAADDDQYLRVNPLTGELHRVPPEFARMSLRPAIGLEWLKKYWREVYPRDRVVMNGKEMKPPRYYDRAFEDPRHEFPGISLRERQEVLYDVKMKRWREGVDDSPYKLYSARKIHESRRALWGDRSKVG